MELLTLFTRWAPNRVFLSILLGALAGIGYALLIPLVLSSLAGFADSDANQNTRELLSFEISQYKFAALFAGMCLFILVARSASQLLLSRVALHASTDLRVKTYGRIMSAPIAELEKLGPSRLLAAITTDVQRIIMGATVVPNLLISFVTLAGMLGYLFFLNADVFWFVMGAVVFGIVTYQVPMLIANRYFERGRAHIDAMQEGIRGLLYGTKELKLSRVKRERYFAEVLLSSEQAVLSDSKRGNTIVTIAMTYGDLISFMVIGFVAYIFVSYHSISREQLLGVVMVLLYITGPVAAILNSIPQLVMANVSLRTIHQVFGSLFAEQASETIAPIADWRSVRFSKVAFDYQAFGSHFKVGPIDLEIPKGEITFIVGGNGSGKSTLTKLISLHYSPREGEIHFGSVKVDEQSINSCRESICAIFADYYLFDRLLGELKQQERSEVARYLRELELDQKVSVQDGRFSTLALSEGQKKRLALLVAFLEDREMYIFDEWAADQDPQFKEVFYRRILPALRSRGKAVVVISHDDRYFDVADRLLVMEDGKLVRSERRDVLAGDLPLPPVAAAT